MSEVTFFQFIAGVWYWMILFGTVGLGICIGCIWAIIDQDDFIKRSVLSTICYGIFAVIGFFVFLGTMPLGVCGFICKVAEWIK